MLYLLGRGVKELQCYYVYMSKEDKTPVKAKTPRKRRYVSDHEKALKQSEKTFALVYAKTGDRVEAIRQAFPLLMSRSSNNYMRVKAHRLLMNDNVVLEVEAQAERLRQIGGKSVQTLEDIMDFGQEHNALDAAKFVYEQNHGKARQRVEVEGKFVTVTYDLSGGKAGAVPQEIIDQLNADD